MKTLPTSSSTREAIAQAVDEVLNVFRGMNPPLLDRDVWGDDPGDLQIRFAVRNQEAVEALKGKGMLGPIRRATRQALQAAGFPVERLQPEAIRLVPQNEARSNSWATRNCSAGMD